MRVALVAGPDAGHAFPTVGLARALQARGHSALVVTGWQWAAPLRREGLEWAELPALVRAPSVREGNLAWRLYGQGTLLATPLADLLRPWRPDLIVADLLMLAGGFAAGRLGLPWVELIPHTLHDPSAHLPPPWSALVPGRGALGRGRDAVLRQVAATGQALALRQHARARRCLGLLEGGAPVARLVAALPALELPRPDWPANAHLIGPLEWDPADVDLAPPAGAGPVVFLSASTVRVAGGLLDVALAGLGDLGVRLACTQFDQPRTPLPRWAAVGPGRQGPLLDVCTLMVSGAGHGILAKALVRGQPVVAVPGGGDQPENALRLARLGAGRRLAPKRLSPRSLAEAVRAVLDQPGYAERARRVGAASAELRPGDAAVNVLESVFADHPA